MVDPALVLNGGDRHQDPFVNPVTTCGVPRTMQDGDTLKYLTSSSQASRRVVINVNEAMPILIVDKVWKNSENLKFVILFKVSATGIHL